MFNFKAGRDFITYKGTQDIIRNTHYYLNEDKAREKVAQRGFETIQKHYSKKSHNRKMIRIFRKSLGKKEK
ncbi:MAG: glycosyltransferase [Candidatus Hodarchaeota archaeon]